MMTAAKAYENCFANNKRELDLESIIASDAEYGYYYAKNIIGSRFIEAEKTIAQNAEWAYRYANDIIEGPFNLTHEFIFKDKSWGKLYARFLIEKKYFDNSIVEWLI
jgi:hypothetical protein